MRHISARLPPPLFLYWLIERLLYTQDVILFSTWPIGNCHFYLTCSIVNLKSNVFDGKNRKPHLRTSLFWTGLPCKSLRLPICAWFCTQNRTKLTNFIINIRLLKKFFLQISEHIMICWKNFTKHASFLTLIAYYGLNRFKLWNWLKMRRNKNIQKQKIGSRLYKSQYCSKQMFYLVPKLLKL